MVKTCTVCKAEKPYSLFWRDKANPSGYRSDCIECAKVKSAEWRSVNREKAREKFKKKYHDNPLAHREKHLKKKYGIDQNGYMQLFKKQNGKCAICQKTQSRAFDVDHCHSTGKVRGLLCTSCNRMLGHAHDDVSKLKAAIEYLVPQVAAEFIKASFNELCRELRESVNFHNH
jgi:hypothetical protein